MSTLGERLARIKAGFLKQAPAQAVQAIERSDATLRASGMLSAMPAAGDPLPAFELPDTEGQLVGSADLIARGPLVVTFYRGGW